MYKSAEVQEWFQYGGEPFHFQIKVYGSSGSGLNTLYLKVQYAKNLRSVMDNIHFVLIPDGEFEAFIGLKLAALSKRLRSKLDYYDDSIFTSRGGIFASTIGGAMFKRLFSRLEYISPPAEPARGELFVGTEPSGLVKRIFSRLDCDADDAPSVISGNYTVGAQSSCFVKKIRMEVKL